MPGILHYVLNNVSTAFLFHQINSLETYTPVVYGKEPAKGFKYLHFHPIEDTNKDDLKRVVKNYNIKAIHAHFGHHGEKAVPLSKELNLPLITSIRGGEASNHPRRLERNIIRYANLIEHGSLFLPVCQQFVPWLINMGFPGNKIKVLYGGIDLNLFTYKPRVYKKGETIKIISVGKTAPKKGYKYLIKALSFLANYLDVELLIISQKNKNEATRREKERLFKMTADLGLKDRVHFIFDLSEDEIAKELHKAHIYVQPSITTVDGNIEGIPNATKEAMATGMPVIATKHAGIPELVEHKQNGLLVKEKSARKIAKAIVYYIKNPQTWLEFGEKARQKVEERFNHKKQIVYQEQLYDQLLEELGRKNVL